MNQERVLSKSPSTVNRNTKRRKVRKGTQSCWECRRRKIRCTFTGSHEDTCDGCLRRGNACVSQEYPDVGNGEDVSNQIGARLGRVEGLLVQLIEKTGGSSAPSVHSKTRSTARQKSPVQPLFTTPNVSQVPDHGMESACSVLGDPNIGSFVASKELSNETEHGLHPMEFLEEHHELVFPSRCIAPCPSWTRRSDLAHSLLSAWPSSRDLEVILGVPFETSVCFHGLAFIQGSPYQCKKAPTGQDLLRLPPQGSSMVLFARKLLILATYLQAFPPSVLQRLERRGLDCRSIMTQAVATARKLVTFNDDLIDSIEGVECLAIEGLYYQSSGDFRRAWLTIRRAMLIAQIMGLHKSRRPPPRIGPEPIACNVPGHMWFRLIRLDRYLSLMLGLPQSSPQDEVTAFMLLEASTPMERLQRIHCTVAGHILQRSEAEIHDFEGTEQIDKLLQAASVCMPPQWWLNPDFAMGPNGKMNVCDEMIRLMDQFTHYHLILRLHLPGLLQFSADQRYEYSKLAAFHASREILSRFMAFRAIHAGGTYCCNIDYLAFIACVALCVMYIDEHCRKRAQSDSLFSSSLAHQRVVDRGMMERVRESVEKMIRSNVGSIAPGIVKVMQHLLFIEKEAAEGRNYTVASMPCNEESSYRNCSITESNNGARVYIPSVGTFDIVRCGISKPNSATGSLQEIIPTGSVRETSLLNEWVLNGSFSMTTEPHGNARISSTPTGSNDNEQLGTELMQPVSPENAQVVDASTPAGSTPPSPVQGLETYAGDLAGIKTVQYFDAVDFDDFLTDDIHL